MPIDTEQAAPKKAPPAAFLSDSRLLGYLLAVLAVSVVLYPLPFYLVRLPSYLQWNRTLSFRPMEFSFKAVGQNADVVIFGDSTASNGIDPSRMSAALGTKVVVLPNNLGELNVIDDLPLRRYIKADRPPRLIVFYFAPWNFDYRRDPVIVPTYDGLEMLMRHGAPGEISILRQGPFPVHNPVSPHVLSSQY